MISKILPQMILVSAALVSCTPNVPKTSPEPLIGASRLDASRKSCEASGGRFGTAGKKGMLVCYRTPPDANKGCLKESDCSASLCLAESHTCAPVTPLFGCYQVLDAAGRTITLCQE